MERYDDFLDYAALKLRLPFDPRGMSALGQMRQACEEDPGRLLDLTEVVLEALLDQWGDPCEGVSELDNLLLLSNSAYKVNAAGDGLEVRVAPEVQKQVQAVVDAAGRSAGDHLTEAWNAAYSRTPDGVKGYSESIKAVEAELGRHISPQNTKQTLGSMIGDVQAKPDKWRFVVTNGDGVGMVLALMRTLWDGQTSRHGSSEPTRYETINEARAAVHIATTLVQFGLSEAFSTNPPTMVASAETRPLT